MFDFVTKVNSQTAYTGLGFIFKVERDLSSALEGHEP